MSAQRGGLGGRSPAREERADESREQIAAAPCCETGVAARHDVLRTAQVGDDGGNAFKEHGASELRRRARGCRPAIVRRFVREGVAGEGAELAQMRRAHDGPVSLTLEIMKGVGVDHGRNRAPAQHLRDERLACRLSPEPGAEHHGIRPLERFGSGRIEILTERRFDGQYIGKTRLRGGNRFARGDQLHESRSRGQGGASGVQRSAAHAVGAADDAHPATIAFMHLRREPVQPLGRPRVGDEPRPCRVGRRKADVDNHDLAAPLAREQVATPRTAERDGDLRAYRAMRFTAREVEPGRSVHGQGRRSVFHQALCQSKNVSLCRPNGTRAKERVDRDCRLGPGFFTPELTHTVEPRQGAVVDRVIGLGIDRDDPHRNARGVERARDDPTITTVVPGARGDQHATRDYVAELRHGHLRDGAARGLHQDSARNPILRARLGIPRRRFTCREDRNWVHGITTPAYPTTRLLSPDAQPEWR